MEEFFTTDAAEEGVKLPLRTPDGNTTKHYLIVRGIDSDVFRSKEAESRRAMLKLAEDPERDEKYKLAEVTLIASLIKGWSFDMECSEAGVVKFLKKAPQIAEVVNRFAGNRSVFFKMAAENSLDGSLKNESLTPNQPEVTSPSVTITKT
jgi:hypothetical protein